MRLVGNIVMDSAERDEFLDELERLMTEYEVDKVDVGWKRPAEPDPRPRILEDMNG